MQLDKDLLRLNALFHELADKYGVERAIDMFAETTDIVKMISKLNNKKEK